MAEFRNDGRRVSGIALSAGSGHPRLIDWTNERPAFDTYNGTFGLVLAAMPLRQGFSAAFPAVAADKSGIVTQTATVLRSEPFVSSRGRRDVWVVEVATEGEPALSLFWVSRQPPYLLRYQTTSVLNGEPAVFTWTSLEG